MFLLIDLKNEKKKVFLSRKSKVKVHIFTTNEVKKYFTVNLLRKSKNKTFESFYYFILNDTSCLLYSITKQDGHL